MLKTETVSDISFSTIMSTSSFVSEVLANAGRLEKEDLYLKLGALSKKTNELKAEVYNSLQKEFIDFYPNLTSAVDLNNRVEKISTEMQNVATKVEKDIQAQLTLSATEFQDLSSQLSEATATLHVLQNLVTVEKAFRDFDSSYEEKNYDCASASLALVHEGLSTCSDPCHGEIKIMQALLKNYHNQQGKFLTDVTTAWVDTVNWEVSKDDGKKSNEEFPLKVSLRVKHSEKNKASPIRNIMQAMQNLGILSSKLKNFSDRLLKSVAEPVLSCASVEVKCEYLKEMSILSLSGRQTVKADLVSPVVVFYKLLTVFTFLVENVFMEEVNLTGPDGDSDSNISLRRLIGSFMDRDIVDLLINKCLKHSIPTDHRDLDSYADVISAVIGFENYLIENSILKSDDNTLSRYAGDVNELFASKKCQEVLVQARQLMTTEIHNMVKIMPISIEDLPSMNLDGTSMKRNKIEIPGDSSLSLNTFQLPPCYISESVKMLMDLAYTTLGEAVDDQTSPECAVQLFYAVRMLLVLYCEVVPTYHKDSLDNLPQITALYHNNCMYIAHNLLTMGHQFRPKLPKPLSQGAATFIDLVPKLRRLGVEAYLRQLHKQRDLLLECLSAAQGFVGVSDDENRNRCERAIKQMLHQVQRLSNVWSEVLPVNVYHKSIGTLLNAVVSEMSNKVLVLEDISADDASQLHALMTIVTDKVPIYYETQAVDDKAQSAQSLVFSTIPKWNRFMELMWLLNAGLQDIADRWADGKGPLATEFQANEVKQLIRALFQNTDKRSRVLATIK